MKKTVCLLCLCSSLLLSDSVEVDKKVLTTQTGTFQEVITYYNNRDFKKSYSLLKSNTFENEDMRQYNFYLGRSAFELGLYEEAYGAFERVLILDSNHTRARLEFARTLYMLKMYEEAKLEFKKVQESNIPKAVKDNIDLFLRAIEDGTQQQFLTQILMFGYQYDTNVNSVYEGNIYYPGLNILLNGQQEEKDSFLEQLYIANHRYDLGKIGEYTWDSTFLIYAQQYKTTHNKNVEFASINTGPTYAASKYSFSVPLIYERLRYGSSTYLHSGGIAFKYNRFLSETLILNNELSYKKKKNLIEANKKNDSTSKSISLGAYKILTQQDSLSMNTSFETERKDSDLYDSNVAQNKYGINFTYTHIFNEKYKLALGYQYYTSRYKDIDTASGFTEKRQDNSDNYNITFTHTINKSANINLKVTHIDNSSNQDQYKYNKDIYGLNLMYQF